MKNKKIVVLLVLNFIIIIQSSLMAPPLAVNGPEPVIIKPRSIATENQTSATMSQQANSTYGQMRQTFADVSKSVIGKPGPKTGSVDIVTGQVRQSFLNRTATSALDGLQFASDAAVQGARSVGQAANQLVTGAQEFVFGKPVAKQSVQTMEISSPKDVVIRKGEEVATEQAKLYQEKSSTALFDTSMESTLSKSIKRNALTGLDATNSVKSATLLQKSQEVVQSMVDLGVDLSQSFVSFMKSIVTSGGKINTALQDVQNKSDTVLMTEQQVHELMQNVTENIALRKQLIENITQDAQSIPTMLENITQDFAQLKRLESQPNIAKVQLEQVTATLLKDFADLVVTSRQISMKTGYKFDIGVEKLLDSLDAQANREVGDIVNARMNGLIESGGVDGAKYNIAQHDMLVAQGVKYYNAKSATELLAYTGRQALGNARTTLVDFSSSAKTVASELALNDVVAAVEATNVFVTKDGAEIYKVLRDSANLLSLTGRSYNDARWMENKSVNVVDMQIQRKSLGDSYQKSLSLLKTTASKEQVAEAKSFVDRSIGNKSSQELLSQATSGKDVILTDFLQNNPANHGIVLPEQLKPWLEESLQLDKGALNTKQGLNKLQNLYESLSLIRQKEGFTSPNFTGIANLMESIKLIEPFVKTTYEEQLLLRSTDKQTVLLITQIDFVGISMRRMVDELSALPSKGSAVHSNSMVAMPVQPVVGVEDAGLFVAA